MKRFALLVAFSLTLPATLLAGEPSGAGIELRQALEHLLAQSPEQALVEARKAEAGAIQRQADGLLAAPPAVSLAAQGGREQGGFGEYREWSAGVDLPIWRPGQSAAHQKLAQILDGLAAEDLRLLQWELAGQLREAAWRVMLAQASVEAFDRALGDARTAQQRLARLVALGERPRADLLTMEGEVLDLEQQLDAAHAEFEQGSAAWKLISRQADLPAMPSETASANQSLDNHPQIAQARKALDRASAERRTGVLAAAGSPSVGLAARHEQPPGGPDLDALTLSLTVPLPWERHKQAAEAPLRYAETEASVRAAQVERAILLQRQEAASGLATARRQAELANKRAEAAREELRLASRRVDEGEMDTIDYVTVMRRSREAERAARLGALEVGRRIARHNQAQGILP